jgi:hypothetical protein
MQINSRIWIFVAFSMRIVHNEEGRIQLCMVEVGHLLCITMLSWCWSWCKPRSINPYSSHPEDCWFCSGGSCLLLFISSRWWHNFIQYYFRMKRNFLLSTFLLYSRSFQMDYWSKYLLLFVLWSYLTTAICIIVLSLIHLFFSLVPMYNQWINNIALSLKSNSFWSCWTCVSLSRDMLLFEIS